MFDFGGRIDDGRMRLYEWDAQIDSGSHQMHGYNHCGLVTTPIVGRISGDLYLIVSQDTSGVDVGTVMGRTDIVVRMLVQLDVHKRTVECRHREYQE